MSFTFNSTCLKLSFLSLKISIIISVKVLNFFGFVLVEFSMLKQIQYFVILINKNFPESELSKFLEFSIESFDSLIM